MFRVRYLACCRTMTEKFLVSRKFNRTRGKCEKAASGKDGRARARRGGELIRPMLCLDTTIIGKEPKIDWGIERQQTEMPMRTPFS